MDDIEYKAAVDELKMLDELVASGVLGSEDCPEPSYLHWPVLKPELLPDWLRSNYSDYSEIRWYTNE